MANLTRFDPFGEMVTLRTYNGEGTSPALDVHQNANEIVVTAALPGMKAADVDITITGQTLSIRGEFKADEKVEKGQYLYRERRHGTFHRQLQLPVRLKGESATASFEDGVLTLTVPKADEVKPRQIEVKPAPKKVEASTDGDKSA